MTRGEDIPGEAYEAWPVWQMVCVAGERGSQVGLATNEPGAGTGQTCEGLVYPCREAGFYPTGVCEQSWFALPVSDKRGPSKSDLSYKDI